MKVDDGRQKLLMEEYLRYESTNKRIGVIAALCDTDDGGLIIAANEEAHRLLHHEREPLVGETMALHYRDSAERRKNMELLRKDGECILVLDLYSQGKQVYLLDHCRLVKLEGQEIGTIATLCDITAQERDHRIVQRAPIGVYVADASNTIIHLNPTGAKMLDYASPDELIGRSLDEVYAASSQLEEFSSQLKTLYDTWKACGCPRDALPEQAATLTLRKKYGNTLCAMIRTRAYEGPDRKAPWREGVFTDATKEAELERSLLRLPGFYELRKDADGVFLMDRCSEHFAKTLFGYDSVGDIHGSPVEKLIDADDDTNLAYWREFIKKVHTSSRPQTSDPIKVVRKDGSAFHIVVNAVALEDSTTGTVGRVGFVYDATDRVEFDRVLRDKVGEQTEELEASLAANRTLLQTVVHELDAPVVSIRGICDNLRHGIEVECEPFPRQQTKIREIEQLCSYALAMVKNVNLASSSEIEIPSSDWFGWEADVIDPAFSHILPQIYNRELPLGPSTFSAYLRGAPPCVFCNLDHLFMVFFNLFSNAVKYAKTDPKGLKIRIAYKYHPADGLTLLFNDWGIGIPKGETNLIFEMHTKGTNAKKVPGKGIGLWVVRRILNLYGASIWVMNRSNPTTFALKFPARMLGDRKKGAEDDTVLR